MRRKILPLAATTVALVLGMSMGSAWAYFTDTTYASGGLYVKPETTTIEEYNGPGTKVIRIKNTSEEVSVWVRARIFAADELKADAKGTNWAGSIKGWYTYAEPVPAGEETLSLTVSFGLKQLKTPEHPEYAETGDEKNVIVVYECVPVTYNADGTLAAPVWAD